MQPMTNTRKMRPTTDRADRTRSARQRTRGRRLARAMKRRP